MSCEHLKVALEFPTDPQIHEETNVRTLRLRIVCSDCGEKMRFIGMGVTTDVTVPGTSTDDTVVKLPFLPRYEEVAEPMYVRQ